MGEILEKLILKLDSIELQGCNIIQVSVDEAEETGTAVLEDQRGDTFPMNWNKDLIDWE